VWPRYGGGHGSGLGWVQSRHRVDTVDMAQVVVGVAQVLRDVWPWYEMGVVEVWG
jgi:hypothetical protein